MKKERRNLIVGVVIGVIIVIVIILIYNASKPQPKEKLTEDDFKIISASWNDYQVTNGGFSPVRMDWDKLCSGEYGTDYLSAGYTITTQQTEESMSCYYIINSEEKREYDKNLGEVFYGFENDTKIHHGDYNLNFKQNNEITICCHSNRFKEGEICKSITLEAKCP